MENLMDKTITEGAIFQDRTVLVQADYLVVGAGAAGMAFVDALIHNADVRVALLDRRPGPGGHWLDAYPFVRLHQASEFYGVVSTLGRQRQADARGRMYQRAAAPTSWPTARVLGAWSPAAGYLPSQQRVLGGRR
jgi:ribulose 1,5-bisphosphate synthetase/thiazole synthase